MVRVWQIILGWLCSAVLVVAGIGAFIYEWAGWAALNDLVGPTILPPGVVSGAGMLLVVSGCGLGIFWTKKYYERPGYDVY